MNKNYTDKELKVIKQRAYDAGFRAGVGVTVIMVLILYIAHIFLK
jgi:hypothetical protein